MSARMFRNASASFDSVRTIFRRLGACGGDLDMVRSVLTVCTPTHHSLIEVTRVAHGATSFVKHEDPPELAFSQFGAHSRGNGRGAYTTRMPRSSTLISHRHRRTRTRPLHVMRTFSHVNAKTSEEIEMKFEPLITGIRRSIENWLTRRIAFPIPSAPTTNPRCIQAKRALDLSSKKCEYPLALQTDRASLIARSRHITISTRAASERTSR